MFNLTIATYYIPYYYQASRGRTPTQSGIDILPFMLTIILGAAGSGAVVNATGRYIWFLRFGPLLTTIGAGLLYTIGTFSLLSPMYSLTSGLKRSTLRMPS